MDKENPLVSIVIPVYNGSNYLSEAIDSALAQTYQHIEVLVINDGSTDNGKTREVSLSYGNRIRYFEKENGGVASALNLGIAKMKGAYFSWLSHDDRYLPEKVENEVAVAVNNNNAVVYSNYFCINETGERVSAVKQKMTDPDKFVYNLVLEGVNGCTLLVPVTAFKEFGLFNELLRTTQDYEYWFRISTKFSFIHITEQLVEYRLHSNQDSLILSPLCREERETLYKKIVSSVDNVNWLLAFSKNFAVSGLFQSAFFALKRVRNRNKGFNLSYVKVLIYIVIRLCYRKIRSKY